MLDIWSDKTKGSLDNEGRCRVFHWCSSVCPLYMRIKPIYSGTARVTRLYKGMLFARRQGEGGFFTTWYLLFVVMARAGHEREWILINQLRPRKMADILQTTFSKSNYSIEKFVCKISFEFLPKVRLTIKHHWFIYMEWCYTPLFEFMMPHFANVYMRHSASMS